MALNLRAHYVLTKTSILAGI